MIRIVVAMLALALGATAPAQTVRPDTPPAVASAPAPTMTLTAPDASDAAIAAFVDGYIANAVDQHGLPSAAVVVIRDGRVLLSKAYGYADLATARRATPDATLYRQASISKLFTWLVVMQQVEAGKLDLDKDVNTYLDFRLSDAFGKPVTLRHLMTHTAGFDERVRGVFDPGPPRDLGTLLRENVPARVYPPGQTMAYSNYGAALAGYIAERAAGRPLLQLIQEGILDPLRMTRSTFAQPVPAGLAPMLAQGYAPGSRTPLDFEYVGVPGAGGMSATASDMGRFMAALLAGGGGIVRPETLATMMTLQRPLGPGLPTGAGLGFLGGTGIGGLASFGHGGNLSGAATLLELFPSARLGIYMAFNGQGMNGAAGHVRRDLIPALGLRLGGRAAPPVRAVPGQSTAADVAGVYVSARRSHAGLFAAVDLIEPTVVTAGEGGSITVSSIVRSDGSQRRFLPVARDRFAEAETGAPLVFERGADGISGMAGAVAYPVAEFDRVGGWLAYLVPTLTAALAILLVTALGMPVGATLRWGWRVRPIQASRRGRRWFGLARLGAAVTVVAFAFVVFYFSQAEANFASITTGADPWLWAIRILMALSALGCVALVLDAFGAWSDGTRGLWRRLWAALAGVAALAVLVTIIKFGLVTLPSSY